MRKKTNLPPYVYRGKSAYEYRPYLGRGLKRQGIRLCGLDAPTSRVWAEWESLQGKPAQTLLWLLTEYLESDEGRSKAPRTRVEQQRQTAFLKRFPLTHGRFFGDIDLSTITAGKMRRFLDLRKEQGAAISGNRELALISRAWNWARERDLVKHLNPCLIVRRNKETPRNRYVTDEEYDAVFVLAANPPYIRPMMELAYLCRMRQGEIRRALKSDITPEGFETRRLKGSRDALTEWSDRLRAAVKMALVTPRRIEGVYVIQDRNGQPITKTAFDSAWQRLKVKMDAAGIEAFNFHDLKAKGVSDFEGDKRVASGHRTAAMVAVYDRKKPTVKPTK